MIRFTYIARVTDGLMLVASMDSTHGSDDEALKQDGKQILRSLSMRSPKQCTFESGAFSYHYLMEENICYLVLAAKAYPKRLAFLFLADLHAQFVEHLQMEHGAGWQNVLQTVDRPYAYIKFDKNIQKLRKDYSDPNSRSSTNKLSSDLNDVTNIMKRNIQDVLDRGERLANAADASRNLVKDSGDIFSKAKELNRLAFLRKWAPVAAGSFFVVFFIYLRFYIL